MNKGYSLLFILFAMFFTYACGESAKAPTPPENNSSVDSSSNAKGEQVGAEVKKPDGGLTKEDILDSTLATESKSDKDAGSLSKEELFNHDILAKKNTEDGKKPASDAQLLEEKEENQLTDEKPTADYILQHVLPNLQKAKTLTKEEQIKAILGGIQ